MGGRRACVLTKRSQGAVEGGEERAARGGYPVKLAKETTISLAAPAMSFKLTMGCR